MDVRRSDIHITLYEAWSCPSYALHGDAGAFRSVFIKSHLNFLSLSLPLSLTHTHTHIHICTHARTHTHNMPTSHKDTVQSCIHYKIPESSHLKMGFII